MRKKVVNIILTASFLSLFLINLVSAVSLFEGIIKVKDSIVKILEPIFSFLLGGNLSGGALFTKALIFIIILSLVWIGMDKISLFEGKSTLKKIITVIVSILAIQGISYGLLNAIKLPYTAVGVSLSAGLPFLLYFFVINKGVGEDSTTIRRTAWIFFGVVFLGLLASKIGGIGNLLIPSNWGLYWIYMVTIILAFAMALLDGRIKAFLLKVHEDKLENINNAKILAKLIAKKKGYDEVKDELGEETYKSLMRNLNAEARRHKIKRRI